MNVARRSLTAALLAIGLLAAWMVVAPPGVSQTEPQCLGATATIVGDQDSMPGDGKITGTADSDIIVGTEEADVIDGLGGDDRICGLGGDDKITGGDGFDRVNCGPGDDTADAERQVNCETSTGAQPTPTTGPPTSTTTTTAPSTTTTTAPATTTTTAAPQT
jgi:hypothetical protein